MRYHQRRRHNHTPQQLALKKYYQAAQLKVEILRRGISECFKDVYDSDDLENMQRVIEEELKPALALEQRTGDDLEQSYRRAKAKPVNVARSQGVSTATRGKAKTK